MTWACNILKRYTSMSCISLLHFLTMLFYSFSVRVCVCMYVSVCNMFVSLYEQKISKINIEKENWDLLMLVFSQNSLHWSFSLSSSNQLWYSSFPLSNILSSIIRMDKEIDIFMK